ncbi:hypothetical protein EW026_g8052 [Hermanssonia centrifuga]|uniref:Uncharacterized protein n=1 Tax=Hermanssonia centrifuga TaxID=98765 RepID=A0A4S4K5T0_9APHY|nr:hypothetical protein EW026_g8052 [Hermanssonia centrifuga]
MDPNWESREENLRFLDALFHALDGNFTQNQKHNNTDVDDFPLTLGAAYFAYENDVAKYIKHLGPFKHESSTCHKFGAMGYSGHWGLVSSTLGLSCARHMFVLLGGGVDLQKWERFANVDFAMISGLWLWADLFMHILAYNINCQYCINFEKRMEAFRQLTTEFESIPMCIKYFPWTLPGVRKFHLPAHNTSCHYKFSLNLLPGAGMMDGESPEQIWASLNALAPRTREMAASHCHDVINEFHRNMNVQCTYGMATFLHHKYVEAETMHARAAETFKKLEDEIKESILGPQKLAEWKRDETEWIGKVVKMEEHKDLKNPYEPRKEKKLTQKQMLADLTAKAVETKGILYGLVGVIEEGMEIQKLKAEILQDLSTGNIPSSTMANI